MSIEDTIGFQPEIPTCVVCDKNLQGDHVFARINHKGTKINLCCPHCLETFQNAPSPYVARRAKCELHQVFKEPGRFTGT